VYKYLTQLLAKKSFAELLAPVFLDTIKLKLNLQRIFNNYIIFIPRNSRNILVKSVSFYLERFLRYRVRKKSETCSGHPESCDSYSAVFNKFFHLRLSVT